MDAYKCAFAITPLLRDRKKKVRRAALEAVATLAQVGTPAVVLDAVLKSAKDCEEKEPLVKVVRTRFASIYLLLLVSRLGNHKLSDLNLSPWLAEIFIDLLIFENLDTFA